MGGGTRGLGGAIHGLRANPAVVALGPRPTRPHLGGRPLRSVSGARVAFP